MELISNLITKQVLNQVFKISLFPRIRGFIYLIIFTESGTLTSYCLLCFSIMLRYTKTKKRVWYFGLHHVWREYGLHTDAQY